MKWYISAISKMLKTYQGLGLTYHHKGISEDDNAIKELCDRFESIARWIKAAQEKNLPIGAALTLTYIFNIRLQKALLYKEVMTHSTLEEFFIAANIIAWKNDSDMAIQNVDFFTELGRPQNFGINNLYLGKLYRIEHDFLNKIGFSLANEPEYMIKLVANYCDPTQYQDVCRSFWLSTCSGADEYAMITLGMELATLKAENKSDRITAALLRCINDAATVNHLFLLLQYIQSEACAFLETRIAIIGTLQRQALILADKNIKEARHGHTVFLKIFAVATPLTNNTNLLSAFKIWMFDFDKSIFSALYRFAMSSADQLDTFTLDIISSWLICSKNTDDIIAVIHSVKTPLQLTQIESLLKKDEFDFLKTTGNNSSVFFQSEAPLLKVQFAIDIMRNVCFEAKSVTDAPLATQTMPHQS